AATTPLSPLVYKAMVSIEASIYGNPSSMHREGRRAFDILKQARLEVATV
ncbi:cysteine desulfurase, partial [Candidatus Kaiserbacteria bacterium]|nr:cysteine desulfurase [Candidatus Kaiserbacteria bacterium]